MSIAIEGALQLYKILTTLKWWDTGYHGDPIPLRPHQLVPNKCTH